MSNYRAKAIHPKTGAVEAASFIDNHFGRWKYAVLFDDGSVYPASEVKAVMEPYSPDTNAIDG